LYSLSQRFFERFNTNSRLPRPTFGIAAILVRRAAKLGTRWPLNDTQDFAQDRIKFLATFINSNRPSGFHKTIRTASFSAIM
jgi:hypothetical protein